MKNLIKQLSTLLATGFAAACCLGLPLALSVLGAAGVSIFGHDAWLYPLFVTFIAIAVWLLYRAGAKRGDKRSFWLGLVGGLIAAVFMWLVMTGIKPILWPVYLGLGMMVAASLWDFVIARKSGGCEVCISDEQDQSRRLINGAAIAVAAAGVFYGLHRSIEVFGPQAEAGDVACYGVNSCKGKTACGTAQNACTGMNACKGKGWINLPEKECYVRGGQLLKGSPGDPAAS